LIEVSGGEKEALEHVDKISSSFEKMGEAVGAMRESLELEMNLICEKSGTSDIEFQKLFRIAESYKMVGRERENYGHLVNSFCIKVGWDKIKRWEEELGKTPEEDKNA